MMPVTLLVLEQDAKLWSWHWSRSEDASHGAGTGARKIPCYGVGTGAMPVAELALEQVKYYVMDLALEQLRGCQS